MKAYRAELEAKKDGFLREKSEVFKWIARTERSLGLPVSVEAEEEGGGGGAEGVSGGRYI